MGKLLGKLSSFCEQAEHGKSVSSKEISEEVIPDLMVYSSQLANLLDVKDIGLSYTKRLEDNIQRLHSAK